MAQATSKAGGICVVNDWHGGQSGMSLPQKTALYERLMTELAADEAIYFADAAHPEHQARPSPPVAGCGADQTRHSAGHRGAGGSISTVR